MRYPGGKASLTAFLARIIELNGLAGCSYYEPFAGGAGAALRLLKGGVVSEIHLNDWDPCIAAFWQAALTESERFAETIQSVPLNIAEWRRQQDIYQAGANGDTFALGFATFYLNRCNRSGMLAGAGPIGGYAQTGSWKMDSRFNRENLGERILELGRKRDQIQVTNLDALPFLKECLPRGRGRSKVLAYLDPPYCSKGNRLYLNFHSGKEHNRLARYMQRQCTLQWVMSYDDAPLIRDLYAKAVIHQIPLRYSLQRKQEARELLIAPRYVQLPETVAVA